MADLFQETRISMAEVRDFNRNVDLKFQTLQQKLNDMKDLYTQICLDLVSRKYHEKLEQGVYQLEQKTPNADNPDVKFLQAQLDNLDPALKSVTFSNFPCLAVSISFFILDFCCLSESFIFHFLILASLPS